METCTHELPLCPQKPRVVAGTVKLEDKQRLAQEEESEAKRLAIMMMKKREKYLYNKIMFGKRRKIREVSPCPWPGLPVRPSPRPVGTASASCLPPHSSWCVCWGLGTDLAHRLACCHEGPLSGSA